eukprot:TRINITY_DN11962_c0_g1_i1.p1 TRINITY_DN11962_c0_g1~~TRINITY_DN11962_c0_g1_i1.p1  ORF type:complete len:138 (-),score=60.41 TRINITY_DN11962_c0_g1_i1:78-443(-)
METAIKIVMLVLIMMARGEAKTDLENLVMEMRMEINELRNENIQMKKDLANTKEYMARDLADTKEDLGRDLANTKEDLVNTKEDLANTKEDLLTKDQELGKMCLPQGRPPFSTSCGYQGLY